MDTNESKKEDAFHLEPGEEVTCYECVRGGNHQQYKRGEAYLVGAGHYPYDGNANHFCKAHVSGDVTVWELKVSSPIQTN